MSLVALLVSLLALPQTPRPPGKPLVVPVVPPPPLTVPPGLSAELPPSTARAVVNTIAPVPPDVAAAGTNATEEEAVVRILDLVEIDGVRANQLEGIGLVTGLNGTGDKGNAARQALSNFIKGKHIDVTPQDVDIANVALVSVTCKLPPFAKAGTTVDVAVQSINGASSLFGGWLMQTPLVAHNGATYVVAQGSVPVGGFSAAGKSASITQNHLTVGVITGGGIVEQEPPMPILAADGAMHLHLRVPNYITAMRVAREIAKMLPDADVRALDAATIRIPVPTARKDDVVAFVAELGERTIIPGDEAIVVVNERTGTVVAGAHVRISTVAVTHGNLTISIAESEQPSQPQPFSDGQTTTVPRTDVNAQVDQRGLQVVQGGTSVSQLAASLNRMGVAPRDLVAIFQALAQAGALHARLEIQ